MYRIGTVSNNCVWVGGGGGGGGGVGGGGAGAGGGRGSLGEAGCLNMIYKTQPSP